MADVHGFVLNLHIRESVRSRFVVEKKRVAADIALHIGGVGIDLHQSPIGGVPPVLGDRLGEDGGGGVGSGVHHLGAGVLVLTFAGVGDGKHLSARSFAHQVDGRILHGDFGAEVAVDPFHRRVLIGVGSLGHQVVHIVGPVLNGRVPDSGTFQRDQFHHRRVERIGGVDRGCAAFDVVNAGTGFGDDESAFELAHIFRVDTKVSLKWNVHLHARRNPDERAAAPNRAVQCGKFVVVGGDDRAEILLDQLRMLLESAIHVQENDALILEFLLQGVIDDFGFVLGRDSG